MLDTMVMLRSILEWMFLIPCFAGALFNLLCVVAVIRYRSLPANPGKRSFKEWPPVTILKPVYGLDKNLRENLRSTCLQDYPQYQVVFSTQRLDDPSIPLLYEVQKEFGSERVSIAIENLRLGTNGKINNLAGGLRHARHEILVISDSDVVLRPDYLKAIVAPLADPEYDCACTLYKSAGANTWYEKIELLTLNADLMTNIVFAYITGASRFLLGATTALRRSTLEAIGGLKAFADYLVEDNEIGRRIWESGRKIAVVPYMVDTIVDLKNVKQWWGHQVYWDQNNKAARPYAYFAAVVIRSVPFALLFALARMFDYLGILVLVGSIAVRMLTALFILGWGFKDREGIRALWLLPLRDLAGMISWVLAYTKPTTIWRGAEFILTGDGRLISNDRHP